MTTSSNLFLLAGGFGSFLGLFLGFAGFPLCLFGRFTLLLFFVGHLGGDEHDAVATAGSVDRCAAAVFKNLHGMHHIGADGADIVANHTIDYYQGLALPHKGVGTAYTEGSVGVDLDAGTRLRI